MQHREPQEGVIVPDATEHLLVLDWCTHFFVFSLRMSGAQCLNLMLWWRR